MFLKAIFLSFFLLFEFSFSKQTIKKKQLTDKKSEQKKSEKKNKSLIMILYNLPFLDENLIKQFQKIELAISIKDFDDYYKKIQKICPDKKIWIWQHENYMKKTHSPYKGIVFFPFFPKDNKKWIEDKKIYFFPEFLPHISFSEKNNKNIIFGDEMFIHPRDAQKIKNSNKEIVTIVLQKKEHIPLIKQIIN